MAAASVLEEDQSGESIWVIRQHYWIGFFYVTFRFTSDTGANMSSTLNYTQDKFYRYIFKYNVGPLLYVLLKWKWNIDAHVN
ncbi:hypothetical protein ALC57_02526 [Trachymyrmex cornetzi]|uniref:Uncharacterized protein n=1 Tax=Trachymyrmex cornetzi TaxID=471704 RepID=A0A195EIK8_9HYME|nr:hypothetical protein ALC57_02526 [Trachymyrmex cornetzi]